MGKEWWRMESNACSLVTKNKFSWSSTRGLNYYPRENYLNHPDSFRRSRIGSGKDRSNNSQDIRKSSPSGDDRIGGRQTGPSFHPEKPGRERCWTQRPSQTGARRLGLLSLGRLVTTLQTAVGPTAIKDHWFRNRRRSARRHKLRFDWDPEKIFLETETKLPAPVRSREQRDQRLPYRKQKCSWKVAGHSPSRNFHHRSKRHDPIKALPGELPQAPPCLGGPECRQGREILRIHANRSGDLLAVGAGHGLDEMTSDLTSKNWTIWDVRFGIVEPKLRHEKEETSDRRNHPNHPQESNKKQSNKPENALFIFEIYQKSWYEAFRNM